MKTNILLLTLVLLLTFNFETQGQDDTVVRFSMAQYENFLKKCLTNPDIIFVTQREFFHYHDSTKIIISLRHDIDQSMSLALKMAKIEENLGIPATYYVLHSTDYYRSPLSPFHNDTVIYAMLKLQNMGHEVGFHNDLLTLQVTEGISPREYLKEELAYWRENGIRVTSTTSHGSYFCHKYKYLNFYFFEDATEKLYERFKENYPNKDMIVKESGEKVIFEKANLSEFGFEFEGYTLDYTKYISDASIYPDGHRKNPAEADISEFKPGDRIIILTHPINWANLTSHFKVFPNPCQNYFYIHFLPKNVNFDVKIYNSNGILVFEKINSEHSGYKTRININLPRGIYFIVVTLYDASRTTYKSKLFVR